MPNPHPPSSPNSNGIARVKRSGADAQGGGATAAAAAAAAAIKQIEGGLNSALDAAAGAFRAANSLRRMPQCLVDPFPPQVVGGTSSSVPISPRPPSLSSLVYATYSIPSPDPFTISAGVTSGSLPAVRTASNWNQDFQLALESIGGSACRKMDSEAFRQNLPLVDQLLHHFSVECEKNIVPSFVGNVLGIASDGSPAGDAAESDEFDPLATRLFGGGSSGGGGGGSARSAADRRTSFMSAVSAMSASQTAAASSLSLRDEKQSASAISGEFELKASLVKGEEAAAILAREIEAQRFFLAVLLTVCLVRPLPVTIAPMWLGTYQGHNILISALPRFAGNMRLTELNHPDFAAMMQLVVEACGMSPYEALMSNGATQRMYGPAHASATYGSDGRVYVTSMLGLLPSFPPAPKTLLYPSRSASFSAVTTLIFLNHVCQDHRRADGTDSDTDAKKTPTINNNNNKSMPRWWSCGAFEPFPSSKNAELTAEVRQTMKQFSNKFFFAPVVAAFCSHVSAAASCGINSNNNIDTGASSSSRSRGGAPPAAVVTSAETIGRLTEWLADRGCPPQLFGLFFAHLGLAQQRQQQQEEETKNTGEDTATKNKDSTASSSLSDAEKVIVVDVLARALLVVFQQRVGLIAEQYVLVGNKEIEQTTADAAAAVAVEFCSAEGQRELWAEPGGALRQIIGGMFPGMLRALTQRLEQLNISKRSASGKEGAGDAPLVEQQEPDHEQRSGSASTSNSRVFFQMNPGASTATAPPAMARAGETGAFSDVQLINVSTDTPNDPVTNDQDSDSSAAPRPVLNAAAIAAAARQHLLHPAPPLPPNPFDFVDCSDVLDRFAALAGIEFAPGVSAAGTLSYHFVVDEFSPVTSARTHGLVSMLRIRDVLSEMHQRAFRRCIVGGASSSSEQHEQHTDDDGTLLLLEQPRTLAPSSSTPGSSSSSTTTTTTTTSLWKWRLDLFTEARQKKAFGSTASAATSVVDSQQPTTPATEASVTTIKEYMQSCVLDARQKLLTAAVTSGAAAVDSSSSSTTITTTNDSGVTINASTAALLLMWEALHASVALREFHNAPQAALEIINRALDVATSPAASSTSPTVLGSARKRAEESSTASSAPKLSAFELHAESTQITGDAAAAAPPAPVIAAVPPVGQSYIAVLCRIEAALCYEALEQRDPALTEVSRAMILSGELQQCWIAGVTTTSAGGTVGAASGSSAASSPYPPGTSVESLPYHTSNASANNNPRVVVPDDNVPAWKQFPSMNTNQMNAASRLSSFASMPEPSPKTRGLAVDPATMVSALVIPLFQLSLRLHDAAEMTEQAEADARALYTIQSRLHPPAYPLLPSSSSSSSSSPTTSTLVSPPHLAKGVAAGALGMVLTTMGRKQEAERMLKEELAAWEHVAWDAAPPQSSSSFALAAAAASSSRQSNQFFDSSNKEAPLLSLPSAPAHHLPPSSPVGAAAAAESASGRGEINKVPSTTDLLSASTHFNKPEETVDALFRAVHRAAFPPPASTAAIGSLSLVLNNLACLLVSMKKFDEAIGLYQRELRILHNRVSSASFRDQTSSEGTSRRSSTASSTVAAPQPPSPPPPPPPPAALSAEEAETRKLIQQEVQLVRNNMATAYMHQQQWSKADLLFALSQEQAEAEFGERSIQAGELMVRRAMLYVARVRATSSAYPASSQHAAQHTEQEQTQEVLESIASSGDVVAILSRTQNVLSDAYDIFDQVALETHATAKIESSGVGVKQLLRRCCQLGINAAKEAQDQSLIEMWEGRQRRVMHQPY